MRCDNAQLQCFPLGNSADNKFPVSADWTNGLSRDRLIEGGYSGFFENFYDATRTNAPSRDRVYEGNFFSGLHLPPSNLRRYEGEKIRNLLHVP